MSPLNDLTKEQLLDVVKKFSEKMKNVEEKAVQLDTFFNSHLVDKEGVPSNQTKITAHLNSISQETKKLEDYKTNILGFTNELFMELEGKPSIKTQIQSHLSSFDQEAKKVNAIKISLELFSGDVLNDTDGKQSIKTLINNLHESFKLKHSEIIATHKAIIIDEEGRESVKTQIEKSKDSILAVYKLLLTDEPERESIKTQIEKLHQNYSSHYKEASSVIDNLRTFYKDVFENQKNEQGEEKEGLKKTTESLRIKLTHLIQETTDKLHAITDSSLHNSFFSRAESNTKEYEKLQKYTFQSVISIAGVTIVFAAIQLINILWITHKFNYQVTYYQLGITLPLIYVVWMFNRNQKIAKKLAEEYHHKAALSEAMTGYRGLYNLNHESPEYLSLFNSIKEQLNSNPSTKIDRFLSLKSPQEDMLKKSASILNPENIAAVVNAAKTK